MPESDLYYLPEDSNEKFYKVMDHNSELCAQYDELFSQVLNFSHPMRSELNLSWNPLLWCNPKNMFLIYENKINELVKQKHELKKKMNDSMHSMDFIRYNEGYNPKNNLTENQKAEVIQYYNNLIRDEINKQCHLINDIEKRINDKKSNLITEKELSIADFRHYKTLYISYIALIIAFIGLFNMLSSHFYSLLLRSF